MVMFSASRAESPGVSPLSMFLGSNGKLVQTGVSSCLQVMNPLSWALQMILWMEMMKRGEYDGDLDE